MALENLYEALRSFDFVTHYPRLVVPIRAQYRSTIGTCEEEMVAEQLRITGIQQYVVITNFQERLTSVGYWGENTAILRETIGRLPLMHCNREDLGTKVFSRFLEGLENVSSSKWYQVELGLRGGHEDELLPMLQQLCTFYDVDRIKAARLSAAHASLSAALRSDEVKVVA